MCILNNIISLLHRDHKSQKELCDSLEISNHVFTDWKSGRSQSYRKYLPQIAAYFHVSVEELLCEGGPSGFRQEVLNETEQKLLQLFRRFPAEKRETVARIMEEILSVADRK